MKFKKVQISAFRIYDNPKDATFDLTSSMGNAASFVSIYAPNGFGKTSFYDAVEFGMTNSIDRFYRRVDELSELANNQEADKFIRNTYSKNPTFVRIETDSELNPIIENKFNKHANQKHDLKLERKSRIVHPFQEVILSQDWISAFLNEEDGESRYKKFVNTPELAEVDNYYRNLKHVFTSFFRKKNDLSQKISEAEKKIQLIDAENLLETVNKQINILVEQYKEELTELSISSSEFDVKTLKDSIADRRISLDRSGEFNDRMNHISTAKSGNDSLLGVESYFSMIDNGKGQNVRLLEIQEFLKKYQTLNELRNEISSFKLNQERNINDQNNIKKILNLFPEYERVTNEIGLKSNKLKDEEKKVSDLEGQESQKKKEEIAIQSELNTVLASLGELNTTKDSIPQMKIQGEQLSLDIQKTEKLIKEKDAESVGYLNEEKETNSVIIELKSQMDNISKDHYLEVSKDDNITYNLVQELTENKNLLVIENDKQSKLEETIKEQQRLNLDITNFIQTGMDIVNNQQTSSCPLCEYPYDNYTELINKITNNKALDDSLKLLLQQKNEVELKVFEITNTLKAKREQLLKIYANRLEVLVSSQQELQSKQEVLKATITNLQNDIKEYKQKKDELYLKLGGLSFEEFVKAIDQKIANANERKTQLQSNLVKYKGELTKLSEQLLNQQALIKLIKEEIHTLESNEKFLEVIQFFNSTFPNLPRSKQLLDGRLSSLITEIDELILTQKGVEGNINVIEKELSKMNKENLEAEKSKIDTELANNNTRLEVYRQYLKSNLDLDLSTFNKKDLITKLDALLNVTKNQLTHVKLLHEEYEKLDKYCDNVWPFIQSEKAKEEIRKTESELEFLTKKVEPILKEERSNTKKYLETRIKDFFHEDLINSLYRKIDPHPDFKTVEFLANFDSDNPRLDVFVRNEKDENKLIPNLYFSTAQINILSLSIFLASALNSKDYQCIFIDDPIQSMDSINVLSTIDLIRSLVVNEGKQIILSTHDENFHNLLKKKMPPELFESKFLELESFGKVKQEAH